MVMDVFFMAQSLIEQLQKEYPDIQGMEKEGRTLVIFANDNTLWKILEDYQDDFNMEFEAGAGTDHFLRIML